jgi:hypothetical protein
MSAIGVVAVRYGSKFFGGGGKSWRQFMIRSCHARKPTRWLLPVLTSFQIASLMLSRGSSEWLPTYFLNIAFRASVAGVPPAIIPDPIIAA